MKKRKNLSFFQQYLLRGNISFLLLAVMHFLLPFTMKAEPVDTLVAKTTAQNFFRSLSEETSRSVVKPSIAYVGRSACRQADRNLSRPLYYIVNMGSDAYVIVAADDRVSPILAYSTTSSFNGSMMPPSMAFMLGEYQQQIELLCENTEEAASEVAEAWRTLRHPTSSYHRSVVVEPLLSTRWNQNDYYNAKCPVDSYAASGHALAGCTAVAMAQIFKYWGYPIHGVGSHSYVANNSHMGIGYGDYGTLTADFASATYDYDNMPDTLSASSSQAEINAVATLIYHCGVSLNTAYGSISSSALISVVDDAMQSYFDYENVRHIYKSVYTEADWLSTIKNELNQMRPVFYTGAAVASVHAFVCDGYDDQNYFHMNWGWGGYADGYYLLSNLSVNITVYNTAQTAVINIVQDPPAMSVSKEELTFFETETVMAEIQRVEVQTENIEEAINVTVDGNFSLSTDSVNFSGQLTLPATGGSFFVKYASGEEYANSERTNVWLTSGFTTDSVRLVGLSYVPACNAPLSMTGVQGDVDTDTNQVMLTWQPPTLDKLDFSWDTLSQSSMGSQAPYVVIPMHRMEETDLLPFHNHLFTHISFIANPQALEYRLVVYKGGYLSNYGRRLYAGTKIVDKPLDMTQLNMGEWNTVPLDTPLVIDASQELWYGVYVAAPAYTEVVPVGGSECVPFKGNIYGYDFSGETFWYPYGHNFVLKATIDNPFIQYEVYRNDSLLTVTVDDTSYADYPPVYAHYNYEVQAVWNNQCGSAVSQMVNFHAPCHVVNQADHVYACDNYVWNEVIYTESGDYIHEYWNEDECWQVDTLHLTLGHSSLSIDSVVACSPYTWIDGNTYTETTDEPIYILENEEGCDSIVQLHLEMLQAANYIDTVVACDAYTWLDGITYTESIQGPTVHYTDVYGCDNATITLNLTILSSSASVDAVEACDSYTWIDGNTYTESTNEPSMTYTNVVGCDSVVTLHLVVNQSVSTEDFLTIGSGDLPYAYADTIFEADTPPFSVFDFHYSTVHGCDSLVTLYLTIEVGIENHKQEQHLTVWPNPTWGQVQLELSDNTPVAEMEIRVYDIYGRLLQKQICSSVRQTLDLSSYAQGIYILRVYRQNNPIGTVKISKLLH